MENQIILATKQLTKKYGDVRAVEQINLNVKKGRIYGLLGRNGAGKTTIMKMVLGLISISEGEIEIFGERLKGNEKSIYTRIGSIIETPSFLFLFDRDRKFRNIFKVTRNNQKECCKKCIRSGWASL